MLRDDTSPQHPRTFARSIGFRRPALGQPGQAHLGGSCPCLRADKPLSADDSADVDLHSDIPGASAVFGEADHHQTERLKRLSHVQAADVERALSREG